MASMPILLGIVLSILHSTLCQQYAISSDGMITMLTDDVGAPIYAQMAPVTTAVVDEPVLMTEVTGDVSAAVDPRTTRMFFRSTGGNGGYITLEPVPEPVPAPVPITTSNGGYYTLEPVPEPAPITNGGYMNLEPVPAPAPAAITNGYTSVMTSDSRFRSNAAITNGYGQKQTLLQPVMAPARFLPSELAEGVSIPQIPGVAGVDYPIFSQALTSSFHCADQMATGYFADIESKCQVFHICQQEVEKFTFLCPNGTMFNEKHSVCDWWYNVRCERPAPIVSGYGYAPATPAPVVSTYAPPPPPPTTTPAPAPIVQAYGLPPSAPITQSYYIQTQSSPEEAPIVTEVINGQAVQEGSVVTEGDALRMFNNLRANRLRTQLRLNSLRNGGNGGSYAQPAVVEEVPVPEVVPEAVVATGYQSQASNGGRSRLRSSKGKSSFRFNGLRNGGSYEQAPAPVDAVIEEVAPEAVAEVEPEVVPEVAPPAPSGYGAPATGNGGRKLKNTLRGFRFNGLRNGGGYGQPAVVEEEVAPETVSEVAPEVVPEVVPEVAPPPPSAGYGAPAANGGQNIFRSNSHRAPLFRFNSLRNGGYQQPPAEVPAVEEPEVVAEVAPEVAPGGGYGEAPASPPVALKGKDSRLINNMLRANRQRSNGAGYTSGDQLMAVVNGEPGDEASLVVMDESGRAAASIKGRGAFRVNGRGQVRLSHRTRSMLRSMARSQPQSRSQGPAFVRSSPFRRVFRRRF